LYGKKNHHRKSHHRKNHQRKSHHRKNHHRKNHQKRNIILQNPKRVHLNNRDIKKNPNHLGYL
jgi:hypothetical protein